MNPCHFCGEPATIHYTSLLGHKKVQQHLCEACARERGVVSPDAPAGEPLNLQALVQLVLGTRGASAEPKSLKCPQCGLKYAQFRSDGRLGCPHDYDEFREDLQPLLERIHRDTAHCGKVPRVRGFRDPLDELRDRLKMAVHSERYEEAALLRDEIRRKEGSDEPG